MPVKRTIVEFTNDELVSILKSYVDQHYESGEMTVEFTAYIHETGIRKSCPVDEVNVRVSVYEGKPLGGSTDETQD